VGQLRRIATNGCETNTQTNDHCGVCGEVPAAGLQARYLRGTTSCVRREYLDCNGSRRLVRVNKLTDLNNCSAYACRHRTVANGTNVRDESAR
jgi:hypothetical protein